MAPTVTDLHSALSTLGPTSESALPSSPSSLEQHTSQALSNVELCLASIPPHPEADPFTPLEGTNDSDLEKLRKEWKSHKLSSKEVGAAASKGYEIQVWKLTAKDGKGTWFARRSVHGDISFDRFKAGLLMEFNLGEMGLVGQNEDNDGEADNEGGSSSSGGAGNAGGIKSVRGIGRERRVSSVEYSDGRMDVYHLSAQFPGPTAPRDFITSCLSTGASSKVIGNDTGSTTKSKSMDTKRAKKPRQFTFVSRPVVDHPECPEKSGYIRGKYESIEFIREVIPEGEFEDKDNVDTEDSGINSDSTGRVVQSTDFAPGNETLKTSGGDKSHQKHHHHIRHHRHKDDSGKSEGEVDTLVSQPEDTPSALQSQQTPPNPKKSKSYPVEWVMITRSDPGGNVPKWMVERGTPGSIVKDADKFLEWVKSLKEEDLFSGKIPSTPKSDRERKSTNTRMRGDSGFEDGLKPAPALLSEESLAGERAIEKEASTDTIVQTAESKEEASDDQGKGNTGVLETAMSIVSSFAPTTYLPSIPSIPILGGGSSPPSDSTEHNNSQSPDSTVREDHSNRPLNPRRPSEAGSIQSFKTCNQHQSQFQDLENETASPVTTPPGLSRTPSSTTVSTIDDPESTTPPSVSASGTSTGFERAHSRLQLSRQKLLLKFEKALEKNKGRKSSNAQRAEEREKRIREKYEAELAKESERYRREIEKERRRREKEAEKESEREKKELEKEVERERKRAEAEIKKGGGRNRASSATSTGGSVAMGGYRMKRDLGEVVEGLTREVVDLKSEMEKLKEENGELKRRLEAKEGGMRENDVQGGSSSPSRGIPGSF